MCDDILKVKPDLVITEKGVSVSVLASVPGEMGGLSLLSLVWSPVETKEYSEKYSCVLMCSVWLFRLLLLAVNSIEIF